MIQALLVFHRPRSGLGGVYFASHGASVHPFYCSFGEPCKPQQPQPRTYLEYGLNMSGVKRMPTLFGGVIGPATSAPHTNVELTSGLLSMNTTVHSYQGDTQHWNSYEKCCP